MAAQKEIEPLLKITLNVYASDYQRLRDHYPQHGPQKVIRALIRGHFNKLDKAMAEIAAPLIPHLDVELTQEELSDD